MKLILILLGERKGDEGDDIPEYTNLFFDPNSHYVSALFPDGVVSVIGLLNQNWDISLFYEGLVNRDDLHGLWVIRDGNQQLVNRDDLINRDDVVICDPDCIRDRFQLVNRDDFKGEYRKEIIDPLFDAYLLAEPLDMIFDVPFIITEAEVPDDPDIQQPEQAPSPEPGGERHGAEQNIFNYLKRGCILTYFKRDGLLDEEIVFHEAQALSRTDFICRIPITIMYINQFIVSVLMAAQVRTDILLPPVLQGRGGEIVIDGPAVFTCRGDTTMPLYRIDPNLRLDTFNRVGGVYVGSREGSNSRLGHLDCGKVRDFYDPDRNSIVDVVENLRRLSELIEEFDKESRR